MNVYKIRAYSGLHMIPILITSISIIAIFGPVFLGKYKSATILSSWLIGGFAGWYVANKASKAFVEIHMDEIGLEHRWIEQFWLCNKNNQTIIWTDINSTLTHYTRLLCCAQKACIRSFF
jgi:hypothetical protein